ncbi:DUF2306 domain-containing protein [Alteromonas halophila]|uniref:DUF2306 domain-containing protein n=1 Tax=Alteromonas halophila TaxID=516698 RepID=A0A918JGE6_9ALTE|nr:DUF2306 domain-containing protein [Alteromonas halophila]GGW79713.1 hypothetical protein GCM10007391_10650 [Alteromonas halophila]
MDVLSFLHILFAVVGLISGAIAIAKRKGDVFHTWIGRTFVASMVFVNVSAFAMWPKYGFSFFQPLALWNLIWLLLGYYYAAKKPNKKWLVNHFYFIAYAYVGVLAAAIARIPASLGFAPAEAAFISIGVVFCIAAAFIEKYGKRIKQKSV